MRILPLLLLVALLLSGCSERPPTPLHENGRDVVAAGEHHVKVFGLVAPVHLNISIELHDGPPVDVLVMSYIDYQGYQQASARNTTYPYKLIPECSGVAEGLFKRVCHLDRANVAIVIENGEEGEVAPPDTDAAADVAWSYLLMPASGR